MMSGKYEISNIKFFCHTHISYNNVTCQKCCVIINCQCLVGYHLIPLALS